MRQLLTTLGSVALAAAALPAGVAGALTPTSDGRSIFITNQTGGPETATPPVPFQPWSQQLVYLVAGFPVSGAFQDSSILADGIAADGLAMAEFPGIGPSESVLDVGFDLTEGSVFSLSGLLSSTGTPVNISVVLERIAPSPAVLISRSGNATLDEIAGMPPGSYRLRAVAKGTPGFAGSHFDFDFQLECSSASPLDSDGDGFVDACDVCPLVSDPEQTDTDGDGTGDACEAPEVPSLGPAASGVLALALLLAPALARRRRARHSSGV